MDVVSQDALNLDFALLKMSTANQVTVTYLADYPDLIVERFRSLGIANLAKNGLSGWALCEFNNPSWTTKSLIATDPASRQILQDYIRLDLNDNYTKTHKKVIGKGDVK